ncbi:heterokaryon incompatibility protein-domain-containing protein [Aspergillus bertholletiae]|uniref:Heterokaryon incompatibility protein-domain-containing protein n=1 Tax=Aspergillus bertholletiae TaxID=1226010 RepID=A0A5N7AU32_9EURO|nr:heterokaryon incompatibility protein-domain-containing protein [Aspergillus bertholletiae]
MFPGLPPMLCDSGYSKWKPIFILTNKGDPAEDFGVPAICSRLPGTWSEDSLAFVKHCMQECLLNHNCSISMFKSHRDAHAGTTGIPVDADLESERPDDKIDSRWPLRLIDVRPFCSEHDHDIDCTHNVRLIKNLPVCPQYITLSHCWGKRLDFNIITTTSNIRSHMREIELDDLPSNFWDAISITRRLGIRYLWIDAICIIQDSPSDWAQESAKMGYIYDGSSLTIAASASQDSTGGCYRSTGMRQDQLGGGTLIKVSNKLINGQPSTLFLWALRLSDNDSLREPTPLVGCPLSQRGWVFQERILSPRTIHFTDSQLVWECREVYEMEDRLPFVTFQDTLSLAMDREISPDRIKEVWYEWLIGFGYACRKFTRMEDRLIAVAGIARSLHERTGIPYIAGLWTKHLGFGLAWLEMHSYGSEYVSHLLTKPNSRRRPSWTWASTDHEFRYPSGNFEEDKNLHYVSSKMKTLGDVDDPFTVIIGGWLKIRGQVYDGPSSHFTKLSLDTAQQEDWRMSRSWVYIRLGRLNDRIGKDVVIDELWLLVQRVEPREEYYERLGIAHKSYTVVADDSIPRYSRKRWEDGEDSWLDKERWSTEAHSGEEEDSWRESAKTGEYPIMELKLV